VQKIVQALKTFSPEINYSIEKAKRIELYKIAAEKGNGCAQNNLGLLYKNGDGVEKDLEKAVYWFDQAVKNGNEVAQYNLGQCYRLGIGVEKDETKAFQLYNESAKQDYLDGKFQLGNCYNKGIGTDINKEKAFKTFEEVAERGHKIAQNELGTLYEKKAFEILETLKEAEEAKKGREIVTFETLKKGHKISQNDLRILYEKITKDFEKAFYWYSKAANNGNEVALYNLGSYYKFGKGGAKKDEAKANEFYEKSAEQGYLKARKVIRYENGMKEKASELKKKAKEKNKFALVKKPKWPFINGIIK
jgi:TPR repeat protein